MTVKTLATTVLTIAVVAALAVGAWALLRPSGAFNLAIISSSGNGEEVNDQGSECWVETTRQLDLEALSVSPEEEIKRVQREAREDERSDARDVQKKREQYEEVRGEGDADERRAERRLASSQRYQQASETRVERFEKLEEEEHTEHGARWVTRDNGNVVAVVHVARLYPSDGQEGWGAMSYRTLVDEELCREIEHEMERDVDR